MDELVLVQHAPWDEQNVKPVVQWGLASPELDQKRVVRLVGGARAKVKTRQAFPVELKPGAPVLVGPHGERGVVESFDPDTGYVVLTARGPRKGAEVWPDPDPWPLPGALCGPRASAAANAYSQDGRRTHLRWVCRRLLTAARADGLCGASWVDAELASHQIAAVRRVIASPTIGHLLADEVGLGKTIEALEIWSALLADKPTLRTLIVAPRSLVSQWAFEIQRRALRGLGHWSASLPRVFVSAEGEEGSFGAFNTPEPSRPVVAEHKALQGAVLPEGLTDLLIVDEAHALSAPEQRGVERLAATAAHTLLLTATPRRTRQLAGVAAQKAASDASSFSWAVGLVDPRFAGDPAAAEQAASMATALSKQAGRALAGDHGAVEALTKAVDAARAGVGAHVADLLNDAHSVVAAAAAEIGPHARVVRTQRRNVAIGLGRRGLHEWRIDYRREELALLEGLHQWFEEAVETGEASAANAKRRAASSWTALRSELPQSLRQAAEALGGADAREEALLDLLGEIWSEDPGRRVVIRAEYAETRKGIHKILVNLLHDGALRDSEAELERWVEGEIGAVALVQHGQESLVEGIARLSKAKDADAELGIAGTILGNLVAFDGGDACVLLGDVTAATGLNLQHASDLIFFDLPWNPRQAEQWIGRLDRLGRREQEPVRIHVLTHPKATDNDLIALYKELGLFDKGYQVPPEVADQVDALIARADRNQMAWKQAIDKARKLLAAQVGEDGDALLDATAPDQVAAAAAASEAIGVGSRAVRATLGFFNGLKEVGFQVRQNGTERAVVEWGTSSLALREVRERIGPRPIAAKPGVFAPAKGTLDVPLSRRALGASLGHWSKMVFSPRHPIFKEVWDELNLEAGGSLSFLSLQRTSRLRGTSASAVALVQTRTFPEAQGECALWRAALNDGAYPDLARLSELLSGSLGRIFSQAAPPKSERIAFPITLEGGKPLVGDAMDEPVRDELQAQVARASPRQLEAWLPSALVQLEAAVAKKCSGHAAANADEQLDEVRRFVAHRQRRLLDVTKKVVVTKDRLVKTAPKNAGFKGQLDSALRELDVTAKYFDALTLALTDTSDAASGATTPVITEVAFIALDDGK